MIEGTAQQLLPAIQFEHGGWYREESKDMAATIRDGRLLDKELGNVLAPWDAATKSIEGATAK